MIWTKENYAFFYKKKRLSELLLNANKHAKILETEKEDKTSKKYIEHKNEMLQYTCKIIRVYLIFDKDCRSSQRKSFRHYARVGLY